MPQKALNDYMMDWLSNLTNGMAPVTDMPLGVSVAYPDITFSNTAGNLVIDPPAYALKITPVQGDAGADAKWVFTVNPPSDAYGDAALDVTAIGPRYTVQMGKEPYLIRFTTPVTSIRYDGIGTPGTTGRVSVEGYQNA